MDDRPRVCLPVLLNWTRPCVSLPGLDNDSPSVSLPGFGDSSLVCLPGLVVTLKYLFACNKWCSPCFCLHGLSVCLFTLIESWSFCD